MKRTKRRQPAVLALSLLALTLIAPWGFGQDQEPLTELRRQAEQGDAEAQYNLGRMYYDGEGMPFGFVIDFDDIPLLRQCIEQRSQKPLDEHVKNITKDGQIY